MAFLLGSLLLGANPPAHGGVVWPDVPLPDEAPAPPPRPRIVAPPRRPSPETAADGPALPRGVPPVARPEPTAGTRGLAPSVPTPAATPPASPAKPPVPPARVTPTCSGRTANVKEMVAKVLDTQIFSLTWREDVPLRGKSASFRVTDTNGAVRIEMINGSGESVGVAPARFCVSQSHGRPVLRVGLQRSSLKFGTVLGGLVDVDDEVDQKLARTANPAEMPLVVSRGRTPGKVRIADGMGGVDIDSDFTATIGR